MAWESAAKYDQTQQVWDYYDNVLEQIELDQFQSVFDFLKAYRYKLKKQRKFEESQPPLHQVSKRKQYNRGITPDWDAPHSIIDEVFAWVSIKKSKDDILQRGMTAQHISAERIEESKQPNSRMDFRHFSPLTLSRAAVSGTGQMAPIVTRNHVQRSPMALDAQNIEKSYHSPKPTIASNWPILQGQLLVQELMLPTTEDIAQFKTLNDIIDLETLEKYRTRISKSRHFIFFKGKLYRFKEANSASCKVLNIKYAQIEMMSVQKPAGTMVFGQHRSMANLEQIVVIRYINKVILLQATSNNKDILQWYELMKYFGVLQNFRCHYEIGKLIGKGNFAKVFEVVHATKRRKFALKTIQKQMFEGSVKSVLGLHDEVSLLRKIRHPNVLQMYEIFESDSNIHMVVEYLEGKELFDQIKERGQYSEKDAATVIKAVLNALTVLHSNNIVHRDLKPENLIFRDQNLSSLVIIDFGLATVYQGKPLMTRCGSPGYVAPEILNNLGYDCKSDCFSVGVIMYILLTSKFVFNAKDYQEILRKNKYCRVVYPSKLWDPLSVEAKDLCQSLLQKNPADRLSAKEALEHPWFTKTLEAESNLDGVEHIYNRNEDVSDALMTMSLTETERAMIMQSPVSQASQLETSMPILNQKKMLGALESLNSARMEQEVTQTFQTPMPQMRFARASVGAVDSRLQKLVGFRGADKKDSLLPTDAEKNIAKGSMTPQITAQSMVGANKKLIRQIDPIAMRKTVGQPGKSMFSMPGLRGGDNLLHKPSIEKPKPEEKKSSDALRNKAGVNLLNALRKVDNAVPEEKKMQSPKHVKTGGTGEMIAKEDISDIEDDCIAVFSSDEEEKDTYQRLRESSNRSVVSATLHESQFQSREIIKKAERLPLSRKIKLMNAELKRQKANALSSKQQKQMGQMPVNQQLMQVRINQMGPQLPSGMIDANSSMASIPNMQSVQDVVDGQNPYQNPAYMPGSYNASNKQAILGGLNVKHGIQGLLSESPGMMNRPGMPNMPQGYGMAFQESRRPQQQHLPSGIANAFNLEPERKDKK